MAVQPAFTLRKVGLGKQPRQALEVAKGCLEWEFQDPVYTRHGLKKVGLGSRQHASCPVT